MDWGTALFGLLMGYVIGLLTEEAARTFGIKHPHAIPLSAYAWALLLAFVWALSLAVLRGTAGPDHEQVRAVSDAERWRVFSAAVNSLGPGALTGVGLMHWSRRSRTRGSGGP